MSDRFFPTKLASVDEIRLIKAIRYEVPVAIKDKENFFDVGVYAPEIKKHLEKIKVPAHYHEHLRRFMWRHRLFLELYIRVADDTVQSRQGLKNLLNRYIIYMDGIAEGLLTTAKRRAGIQDYRSRLFDMYLVIEHYVGRHEFDVAFDWRERHPDIILECIDHVTLGMVLS